MRLPGWTRTLDGGSFPCHSFDPEIRTALLVRANRERPVEEWTICLVRHTHTDIGCTRPQTEILSAHIGFIDRALDLRDEHTLGDREEQVRQEQKETGVDGPGSTG